MRSLLAAFFLLGAGCAGAFEGIKLDDQQALAVGKKIWLNECGGTVPGLTHWNAGEDFASLGIGHFIWYPKGYQGPFTESFPELLDFLEKNGVILPAWLKNRPSCPWPDRTSFFADFDSPKMKELRSLLENTVSWQARFAADRLEAALPKMLQASASSGSVRAQFYRVAAEANGVYALVDYVNFKGEGISLTERYNGEGWGLLQVLEQMKGSAPGQPALDEFADAADFVLTRRVANSPPARNESRWLKPWRARLKTYRSL